MGPPSSLFLLLSELLLFNSLRPASCSPACYNLCPQIVLPLVRLDLFPLFIVSSIRLRDFGTSMEQQWLGKNVT